MENQTVDSAHEYSEIETLEPLFAIYMDKHDKFSSASGGVELVSRLSGPPTGN